MISKQKSHGLIDVDKNILRDPEPFTAVSVLGASSVDIFVRV